MGGSRRKQQEAEGGPSRKRAAGGGSRRKQQEAIEVEGRKGVPVERELREEWRGVVREGGRGGGGWEEEGVGAE